MLLIPAQSQNLQDLKKDVNYNPMNVRIKSEHDSIVKRSIKNRNKEFIFFNP
jgi:hypothetical protein